MRTRRIFPVVATSLVTFFISPELRAQEASVSLTLEQSSDGLQNWQEVPLTTDMINNGVLDLNNLPTSAFFRMKIAWPSWITVQGGFLPLSSELAGTQIATFRINRFEVTWSQWQTVRAWAISNGYTDLVEAAGTAGDHPVRRIGWHDAIKWCNAKSEMEGLAPVYWVSGAVYRAGQSDPVANGNSNGYRLPTEAEWEWAARGGLSSKGYTYSGANDLNSVAWYAGNAGGTGTQRVGTKAPNELGIHDMSGNVWEWCFGATRFRGGGWIDADLDFFTVRRRNWGWPGSAPDSLGFRLARNAP